MRPGSRSDGCGFDHFQKCFIEEYVCPSNADMKIQVFTNMRPARGEQPAVFFSRWDAARKEAMLTELDKLAIEALRNLVHRLPL